MKKLSELSQKIEALSKSMEMTRDIFNDDSSKRIEISKQFYSDFFNQLIYEFDPKIFQNEILGVWALFFGQNIEKIKFLAVDGTSFNVQGKNFVTFYGGAFGITGKISKDLDMKKIVYPNPSKFEKAEGVIAYAPLPYSRLVYYDDGTPITVEEEEKVNLLGIHNKLMTFAEFYLIFKEVSKSEDYPNFVLYDGSISSKQMTLTRSYDNYNLSMKLCDNGNKNEITKDDYEQILLRPFNPNLRHPSEIKKIARNYSQINPDIWERWVSLMIEKGQKLFDKNDWSALYEEYDKKYVFEGENVDIKELIWLSGDDLDVLSLVALLKIIEICWEKNILFTGVSKDSGVTYLTKRYIKQMKNLKIEPYKALEKIPPILYTDILFLEAISLDLPYKMWTTIEYDSCYATLNWDDVNKSLTGIKTLYWSPEHLFLKSISSLYKHIQEDLGFELLSIDRLIYKIDLENVISANFAYKNIKLEEKIELICYKDNAHTNKIQLLNLYLLLKCCRNRNLDAIGYPHPLFLADKYAKNYLEFIKPIMNSGNKIFFRHPKFWTRRQHRSKTESGRKKT